MLAPGDFNTELEANGDVLMYPEGDRSAPPSGRMPNGGYFLDTVVRQPPLDESKPRVEDNLEEFGPISMEDLEHFRREAEQLRDRQGNIRRPSRHRLRRYRSGACTLNKIPQGNP